MLVSNGLRFQFFEIYKRGLGFCLHVSPLLLLSLHGRYIPLLRLGGSMGPLGGSEGGVDGMRIGKILAGPRDAQPSQMMRKCSPDPASCKPVNCIRCGVHSTRGALRSRLLIRS